MKTWFRNIGLLILLLTAGRMAAQVPVLDSVCFGAVRDYRVDGETGSTYSWILTPPFGPAVMLPSDTDTLEMTWNYPGGVYELQVIQHALNGCDAEAVFGQVLIFEQPDVFAGPDDIVCVGRYYKLMDATAANYSSLLWSSSGDGTFDNAGLLNATYTPGANDILAGTVTLTLTGFGLVDQGGCDPSVSSMELAIVFEIVPQFESIGPLCQYNIAPALPDTSLEGMTGIWMPPVISTDVLGNFPYLFIPDDPAQCGVDTTIYITITSEIIPQFDPIGPLCINITAPALPDTSLEGITGTWVPPVISTDTEGIFTYIFSPDDTTQCGVETSMDIAVVTEITPVFEPIGPLCQFNTPPALPDTSLNGIAGTWDPPFIVTGVTGTFSFTFTPYADQCGVDTIIQIVVLPLVIPEFDSIGPFCQYSAAIVLPDTSLNGIGGTWNPAWINTSVPGIFTYTFTPDPGQCGTVVNIFITIIPEIVPEFDPIGPLCLNTPPPALPDTSLQGIPGTWIPPFISTDTEGTFFYTFTPDPAYLCTMQVTIAITVISDIIPDFDPIDPLCQNSTPPALPDTSLNGITGTWDPPVINTGVTGTSAYFFTPDEGQCAVATSIDITIVTEIMPVFNPIDSLCQNSTAPALPDTSLNGITGTWDPPVINTGTPGTINYVFMPDDPYQCGVETSMDISVVTEIVPVFDPIGPICQHIPAPALPGTSLNGITGTWQPPTINTDDPDTIMYIFTPDNQDQCGVETSMEIAVVTEIIPAFDPIGPLCQNITAPALHGTSLNGITGVWEPPTISTAAPGTITYNFTPDNPGQCGVVTSIDITIVSEIVPVFDQIGPLCQGIPADPLPLTSLNGITGTWVPPVPITNFQGTSTYTFTPADGQCGMITTMDIEVTEEVTPLFDPIGPLSLNSTAPLLPGTSLNNITGTWEPDEIDTSIPGIFAFTFSPDEGQCAIETDILITILQDNLLAIAGPGKHCLGHAAIVPVEVDKFVNVVAFQLKMSYNVDKLLCEGYANAHPQLADHLTGTIDQVAGVITLQWQNISPVTFSQLDTVCDLVFTLKQPGQGILTWYTSPTESYFTDPAGMPIPAEFFAADMNIYDPPEILMSAHKTVCEGDTVTIYGIATSTQPPVSYKWTYPDGHTTTTDPFFAGVTHADAGDYTLLATDTLGCTDQKTIRLVVSDNPVADFNGTDTMIVAPGYTLEAGYGLAYYLWNTGETTESITIDTTGWYWVQMESNVGCIGIDSVYILISDEIVIECLFIPNAFTPNSDGLNDIFKPVTICSLSFYRMFIYNRWGEEFFESSEISIGWDGKKNGSLCAGDVYVYKIVYKVEGTPEEAFEEVRTGAVLILK